MRTPHRQMITGLVLSESGPRVPKKYLKQVRAMIHNANRLIDNGESPDNIDEIKGRLSFIKMVMPEYAIKTCKKYPWLTSAANTLAITKSDDVN